ncbi:DUF86 domain-containing protein [Aciduricibacillus chroicocephali]|uniref:DUF86 domain-containing protein n=1 Tax=Aciduricibacillus chroicocephali TaxID=3054939 RepID=A0ABY9KUE3_9BACI|nr:DUF86 domain-containing protein [Bacillaceae bacterium 44XB]
MYLIDKDKITDLLNFIEKRQSQFDEVITCQGNIGDLARERYAEVLIASILDVGHLLIDGFMMRDAGSYEDIICILVDEQVIPEAERSALIGFISMRAMLMRSYDVLDAEEVLKALLSAKESLQRFPLHIRTYLKKEANVAHAFGKKSD